MEALQAEGWKWVKAEAERDYSVNYGRVYPSRDENEDEGEEQPRYAAEDIARAGAFLRVERCTAKKAKE